LRRNGLVATFGLVSIKEQALRVIEALPENSTWEEAVERMRVAAAIAKAETDIDAGRYFTQEKAEAEIDACLRKLSGRRTA
jgi:predicted transcriptional regulator